LAWSYKAMKLDRYEVRPFRSADPGEYFVGVYDTRSSRFVEGEAYPYRERERAIGRMKELNHAWERTLYTNEATSAWPG
jgi:hypothetical protein